MAEGRLTPFGEVLTPLLERAGLTPRALLVQAGRIEEPNAEEILLRYMYGPPTEVRSGYLIGWIDALALIDEEAVALSSALNRDLLRVPDPLSRVNRPLTGAIEGLEAVPAERFASREDALRVQSLVAEAGQIVAAAESVPA